MDTVSKKKRSEIMSRIRSKNTKPEMLVRKYLSSKGYKYSLHDKRLPGKPDIVLKRKKIAIQVRGCFWHGHKCNKGGFPKSNRKFWKIKIKNNKKRDKKNDRKIRSLGFKLIIIWECELKKNKFKKKLKF